MTCVADNSAIIELNPDPSSFLTALADGRISEKKPANSSWCGIKQSPGMVSINLKPEQYIAFQMSFLKPEVKDVFVYQNDGVYYVTVMVDNRDLALNRKIFEREREIMHFYRQFRFDLTIIPLANRKLSEVCMPKGTRVI